MGQCDFGCGASPRNIRARYHIALSAALRLRRKRLHFSNFCGTEPVTLTRVTLAHAVSDREISLKDAAIVTFSGKESVTIAAGEEIFSDETDFCVKPREVISVSVYLKEFTLMRSGVVITGPLSKGFFSLGDKTFSETLPLDTTRTTNTFYFLTGICTRTQKIAAWSATAIR